MPNPSSAETQTPSLQEQAVQHEALTDERLASLLTAVGNHESKALLLLAMEPGVSYSQSELRSLIVGLPGSESAYLGNRTNQMYHCQSSLEPAGLAERDSSSGILTYRLSEEGETLGQPLAALLLEFADSHQIPLSTLFGRSNYGVNRRGREQPHPRLTVIKTILGHSPISYSDIAKLSGIRESTAQSHIDQLAAGKLIEFNPWRFGKNEVMYRVKDPGFTADSLKSNLGKALTQYMLEHQEATLTELAAHCRSQLQIDWPEPNLRHQISVQMRHLEVGSKFIERFGVGSSIVSLLPTQRALWNNLVKALEDFKAQKSQQTAQLKQRGEELLADRDKVRRALERSMESSPYAQNGTVKRTAHYITQLFLDSDTTTPMSVPEMEASLASTRQFSNAGIRLALSKMSQAEGIQAAKKGHVTVYQRRRTT